MDLNKLSEEQLLVEKEKVVNTLNTIPRTSRYTRRLLIRKLERIDSIRLKRAVESEGLNGKEETTKSN